MKDQIEKQRAQLAILDAFEAKFGAKIPDGITNASVFSWKGRPEVEFQTGYSDNDRARVLCLVGLVFGPQGWTSEKNYSDRFDWSIEIDGVLVIVKDAEVPPAAEKRAPVPPSKFPLLLNPSPVNGSGPMTANSSDDSNPPCPF